MYVCIYPFQQRQQGCFMESVLSRLGFKERMEADAECKQAYQQARAIRWAAEKIPHSNLPLYWQKKVWWQPQHKKLLILEIGLLKIGINDTINWVYWYLFLAIAFAERLSWAV